MNTLQRKGMVAVLFLAFGFLVFSYLVVSNKVVHKETFVGKEALDVYLGGQDFERIDFFYSVAGTHALEQALHDHGLQGGLPSLDYCMVNGYRLWFTEDCPFVPEQLEPALFSVFDPLFHHWSSDVSDDTGVDITFPFTYTYAVENDALLVTSQEPLTYLSHSHMFAVPLSFSLQHDDLSILFSTYEQIVSELATAAPCLLSKPVDLLSCFPSSSLDWTISLSQEHFFFTVVSDEFISDIEIRFAIPLNSLNQLTSTDELFITPFGAESP